LNASPLDESGRCGLCRLGARGFDAAYTYGEYDGSLRGLIHLYKYAGIRSLRGRLAGYLGEAAPAAEEFDWVTAVPMHWWKQWRRGFNQAADLGRSVARSRGIPYRSLLRRAKAGSAQARMTAAARRRNARGLYAVADADAVRGKRILLIDDVLTTGATLAACAAALRRAGAERVVALAVARVDRRLAVEPFPESPRRRAAGTA
jgi:ComF family protein